jgi:hypothetical protein
MEPTSAPEIALLIREKFLTAARLYFPMLSVAVDTGPSVVSRKSARCNGRCAAEKNALVIDRFFETRNEALAWTKAHGRFMTVRVVTPESTAKRKAADANRPGSL